MSTGDEVEWPTLILCVLPAIVSVITLPYGYGIFSKDLKHNILNLSPLNSGLLVFMSFFRVLSWKILNAGDISLCLWSAAALYIRDVWSEPKSPNLTTSRSHYIARWALFLLITFPQYIRLVTFRGVLWTQIWATCFVMHFITYELLAYQLEPVKKNVKFQPDWPAKPFMRCSNESKSCTASDAAPEFRSEKNENTSTKNLQKKLNACDAVQSFIFPLAEKSADQERHVLSNTELAGFWMTMVNPSFVWSCGHVRCLLYKFACIPAYHAPVAWIFFTFLLSIWLLHSDLRFATVTIAESMLKIPSIDEWVSVVWRLTIHTFYMILSVIICFTLISFPIRRTTVGNKIWSSIKDRRHVKGFVVGFIGGICGFLGLIASLLIRHARPTPKNTAWVIEGILWVVIIILVAYLTIYLLGIRAHDLDNDAELFDEESHTTISSGFIGGKKEEGAQKEPVLPRLELIQKRNRMEAIIPCANFLVAFPAALFWYAFCYQPAQTMRSHWHILSSFGQNQVA